LAEFCELNYGVSFPMSARFDVNGDKATRCFVQLKEEAAWFAWQQGYQMDFTKFPGRTQTAKVVQALMHHHQPGRP